jgi:hypothetical protein
MASGLFTVGRAMGVMPAASAAMAISSTLSGEREPCSQSRRTQSNPSRPTISTICGEGNITDTPSAG